NVLNEHYVVYNWALEEGYALTDEQKQEVLDQIEETKNSFETEEEYNEALASSHLTPELYEKMLMADTVINNFSDAIYDTSTSKYAPNDVDVMTLGEENGIIASKHILLLPGDTAEEEEEILKKMNEILERINNGEDFDDLMNEFSEDPGLATYPDGYTFMDGEMVTEFYDATKALEVGGVSGIVRSSSGYHIIKRVDPDFEETKARLISLAVDADLEERLANAKVKLGKGYDKIQFSDFNILPETTDSEEAA
ncbi:MAG: peptidylprolyl isomerase, partial [Oscillospiraceae bacterium]|nr:peptidylprolyl isomerase [Oscillospiraceae bacterium]